VEKQQIQKRCPWKSSRTEKHRPWKRRNKKNPRAPRLRNILTLNTMLTTNLKRTGLKIGAGEEAA
jgi:hypothetical protein